jgi:hypothetical protein
MGKGEIIDEIRGAFGANPKLDSAMLDARAPAARLTWTKSKDE